MHLLRLGMMGLSACTLLVACARAVESEASSALAPGGPGGAGSGGGSLASAATGTGGGSPDDTGWHPPSGGSTEPCNDLTQYIYVVSGGFSASVGRLYSFWPPSLTFHLVGNLMCPTQAGAPISMAIDRHGTAWVLDVYGAVYRIDLATGKCTETPLVSDPLKIDWRIFGMTFVSDGSVSAGESLYVREALFYDPGDDPWTRRLGLFDPTAFTITPLGEGAGGNSDLTGTGDGRLFGLVKRSDQDTVLTEFDKSNGAAITETPLAGISVADAWALSAWGGAVWLFTSQYGSTSDVDRFDPATGHITPMRKDVGFKIVGAGVSACAPITPPN